MPADLSRQPHWQWLVDNRPNYHKAWLEGTFPPTSVTGLTEAKERRIVEAPKAGPGTEMKALLHKLGINPTRNCTCESRARIMDEKGAAWCEEHIELIVDWLQEEARRRKVPFLRTVGYLLVKRAVHNAKKKLKATA